MKKWRFNGPLLFKLTSLVLVVTLLSVGVTTFFVARLAQRSLETLSLIHIFMLPGKDGYDVCKEIRRNSNVPIIMLTAKETELERVLGLELGADDYMTKPFSPLELVARIKAVLRRASGQESQDENEYKVGNIHLQVDTREVRVNDQLVELTRKEFDLLHIFMQNVGKVMTREVLLQKVWGCEYEGETLSLIHI